MTYPTFKECVTRIIHYQTLNKHTSQLKFPLQIYEHSLDL